MFLVIDVSNTGLGEALVWVGDLILLEGITDCKPIFKEPYRETQALLSKLSPGLCKLHSYNCLILCYSLLHAHNINLPSS